MKIKDYLKDRHLFLLVNIILFILLSYVMIVIGISINILLLTFCIWFMPLLSFILLQYVKHKKYYDELSSVVSNLDKKYLLPEVVKEPDFIEGKIIHDLLKQSNKDMHEHVKKYRDMQSEYREYIETWVHEIKTPIASAKLIIENNQNETTKHIDFEITKLEHYIEQVLYYARSSNVSKDYIIKELSLADVVRNSIKKNSRDFINKKISVDIEAVKDIVYSDSKWLEFILNQIIGNSIKYCKEKEGKVTISSIKNENNVILAIEDNGIGIIDKDINKVFEKGFTGENGRIFGKSTGIGLYLCKNLCDKLGLGLNLTSKPSEGTTVRIIFPISKAI